MLNIRKLAAKVIHRDAIASGMIIQRGDIVWPGGHDLVDFLDEEDLAMRREQTDQCEDKDS